MFWKLFISKIRDIYETRVSVYMKKNYGDIWGGDDICSINNRVYWKLVCVAGGDGSHCQDSVSITVPENP